jgi:hypothetical protein
MKALRHPSALPTIVPIRVPIKAPIALEVFSTPNAVDLFSGGKESPRNEYIPL